MPNPLTGDFDAVVQFAVRQVNALLATLHQNGMGADTPLKLLHSERVRIGDRPDKPSEVGAFGDWVLTYGNARLEGPKRPVQDLLVDTAPPGASKRLEATFEDLVLAPVPPPPDLVSGRAAVQLSTVRLSVEPGSTSEITVHTDIRAHYEAAPRTAPLPPAIHGEVTAVFEIRKLVSQGKTRLAISITPDDNKIDFVAAPGSGLSSADTARIAKQIRELLRRDLTLLPVDLAKGFPVSDFRGVGSGPAATIAMPLNLSNTPPPSSGAQGITQSVVGDRGFAFAVSREHVESLIDLEAIREEIKKRTIAIHISVLGLDAEVTYRLRFSSGPTLTFETGAIEIAGRVEVESDTFLAPNGSVSFKQRITLVLDPATQRVDLEADGEPDVDQSLFIPHGVAVNVVTSEIAKALSSNTRAVRRVFRDARTSITTGLRNFDQSASVTFTELEITPNGVIVRGDIGTAPRIPPVIVIEETRDGQAFTAFNSWIPGGRIDRYTWSWVEYPSPRPSPWSGVAKSVTETARFSLEKPAGITEISQICLRVTGARILPDGLPQAVSAGTVCEVSEPVLAIDTPSWWEPVLVPVWRPDLVEDARLDDGIVAHLSVQSDRPRGRRQEQNALVVFPELGSSTPFQNLIRGIEMMRRHQLAPAVIIVMPAGSFNITRRELEVRLDGFPAAIARRVQVVEDLERGWSRTFDVSVAPSLYLINARREFVWQAVGDIDPADIAAALDQHVVPTAPPRFVPYRQRVAAGDRAPDVEFKDDRGEQGALHRLRGRSVLMTFWQSSSTPSLRELRRLQALLNAPQEAPFIVAFHGGAEPKDFYTIRQESGLTFPIVQDREQRVARAYGVRCWPTTIAIDPGGFVEHIQFGFRPTAS